MPARKIIWRLILCLAAASLVCSLTGCSKDDKSTGPGTEPPPVTQEIGPEGGVIEIPGQIRLIIPPGAIADTIDFAITRNSSPAPPGGGKKLVSPVFTIEPAGTSFVLACTLIVTYSESMLSGVPESFTEVGTCANTS